MFVPERGGSRPGAAGRGVLDATGDVSAGPGGALDYAAAVRAPLQPAQPAAGAGPLARAGPGPDEALIIPQATSPVERRGVRVTVLCHRQSIGLAI